MLKENRIFYLDSMRAILMILGILLHTANIYSPSFSWLVSAHQTSVLFALISDFIGLFRMPAFFMVSGFFFVYIYLKRQRIHIIDRLSRLVIPLLVTAVTLNVVQDVMIKAHNDQALDFAQFFSEGGWVLHLWFLINLTVYNLLMWVLFLVRPVHKVLSRVSDWLAGPVTYRLAILVFPLTISGIYGLNKVMDIYSDFHGVTSPFQLLYYFQFFALGLLFGYGSRLLERFSKPKRTDLLIFAVSYFASFLIQSQTAVNSTLYEVSGAYNHSLVVLFLSSMCFFLFRHFLDFRNRALGLISASAYTIYLLHHILVVALGILFVEARINMYLAYFMIVALTFALTIFAHLGIARSQWLSLLLNGIRPKKFRGTSHRPLCSAT